MQNEFIMQDIMHIIRPDKVQEYMQIGLIDELNYSVFKWLAVLTKRKVSFTCHKVRRN